MKKLIATILIMCTLTAFAASDEQDKPCSHWASFFKPVCQRLHQIWTEGDTELYISGYAWHNRHVYSREKIDSYNELASGGGLGKGLFDEKGNWHGLYAIAFLDSHRHIQPAAGYAYLKVAHLSKNLKAGIGYTALLTSRVDINNSIPFPGALPWASVFFKEFTVAATYIPGFNNNGNVLYILGKYTFKV